jgi:hypothetical protein
VSGAVVPGPAVVLAIDPGRNKCGVAICSVRGVVARTIVAVHALPGLVTEWQGRFGVTEIVVGDRTGSAAAIEMVAAVAAVPVRPIEEAGTTLAARTRYFTEHPPRGWRRLLPRSLQTPPEPYDDYVAVLLAEAALAEAVRGRRPGAGRSLP